MISIQTNVTSLMAQQNLNTDNAFQSKTIEQLTSGYRINSSGDDAAGLAIANGYQASVAELTQGVSNANDGTSQLQIIDGGLSNISTILNRMKTLATQSASGTFTGSRATLNQEYSGLVTEINRQAANINLNSGGSFNANLGVYIGGAGSTQSNASVNIDLSGAANAVDATSLGLANTNVLGGGVSVGGNTQRLDAPGATFVKGIAGTDDQTFTFNVYSGGNAQTVTATVAASTEGSTETQVLSSLNGQLNKFGITAGTDNNGALQFSGATPFTMKDNASLSGNGTNLITNEDTLPDTTIFAPVTAAGSLTLTNTLTGATANVAEATTDTAATMITKINAQTSTTGISAALNSAGTGINLVGPGAFTVATTATGGVAAGTAATVGGGTSENTSNYVVDAGKYVTQTGNETLQFQTSAGAASVTLGTGTTVAAAIAAINAQTSGLGVDAVLNAAGNGISFQGANSFSVNDKTNGAAEGVFGAAGLTTGYNASAAAPPATSASTGNGTAAITAIDNAITALGLVQGSVGAGENKLQYATNLAQSQITSYSAAESQIKDADVAAQAANLTKAQVLVQTSVAALAQANSAPQSILKLLQ
jgi:flagellin